MAPEPLIVTTTIDAETQDTTHTVERFPETIELDPSLIGRTNECMVCFTLTMRIEVANGVAVYEYDSHIDEGTGTGIPLRRISMEMTTDG